MFRNSIQKSMKSFGIREEKRQFKPHLTLGRFRKEKLRINPTKVLNEYAELRSPVCPLNELILFKSDLKPGGAVYTKLQSWPLMGKK